MKYKPLLINESVPHARLQWKGTDACIDFYCDCGIASHIDGDFIYYVECGNCGRIYELNPVISVKLLNHKPDGCIKITDSSDKIYWKNK